MALKTVSCVDAIIDCFNIDVTSSLHVSIVDQPVAGGGVDAGPTPLEYLFVSLAGCIVTIGTIVARQQRLPVRKIEVHVEGELELDVLMGKPSNARAGFNGIRVHTKIDADMTQEEKERFIHEVDARCPISDNIAQLTQLDFVVE